MCTTVLMSVCGAVLAGTPGSTRQEESAAAAARIRQMHFFAEGRGMHVVPGIFGVYEWIKRQPEAVAEVTRRLGHGLGLNIEGQDAVGLFGVDYAGSRVGVLGCVACHSGRAAGVTHVGLGNKNIDVGRVGQVSQTAFQPFLAVRALWPRDQRPLIDRSQRLVERLADERYTNLTQGLVPVALVWRWFFDQAGAPMPENLPRGAVKVAHLWGYKEKREVGLFCDGFGDGRYPGWAALVELTAGQTPEAVRGYAGELEEVEKLFEKLLPPPYPFEVDHGLASRGREVFDNSCRGCHGEYRRDSEGLPIFEAPKFILYDQVRTDADRLRSKIAPFRHMVAASPLNDLIRTTDRPDGYFAPRLDGIWARFPYLHNASVPTIEALLTVPEERPRCWSLRDAGEADRFDPLRMGLTLPQAGSAEEKALLERAERGARDVYFTPRPGHSSQGHPFGTSLSAQDKAALIEYLKTL